MGGACGGSASAGPDAHVIGVSAVTPSSASRDITLDVRVQGSGFERGVRAVLARNGDTAFTTTKVKTNSTTFQSGSELVVNLTIHPEATLGWYDILVLNPGPRRPA